MKFYLQQYCSRFLKFSIKYGQDNIMYMIDVIELLRLSIVKIPWSNAKACARRREGCCIFHYLSRTDSIKPILQFSITNFGFVAFEGSFFTRIFTTNYGIDMSEQEILIFHCKKSYRNIIFIISRILDRVREKAIIQTGWERRNVWANKQISLPTIFSDECRILLSSCLF